MKTQKQNHKLKVGDLVEYIGRRREDDAAKLGIIVAIEDQHLLGAYVSVHFPDRHTLLVHNSYLKRLANNGC